MDGKFSFVIIDSEALTEHDPGNTSGGSTLTAAETAERAERFYDTDNPEIAIFGCLAILGGLAITAFRSRRD